MTLDEPEPVYIGVDNEPAPLCDVMNWVAGRLGVDGPQVAENHEGANKRRGGSKRCSNARLRASGFEFLYPDYRHGYAAMLEEL